MIEEKDERGFSTHICKKCGLTMDDAYKNSSYDHDYCLKCSFLRSECYFKNKFRRIEIAVVRSHDGSYQKMPEECVYYEEYKRIISELEEYKAEMMRERAKLKRIMLKKNN